MTEHYEAGKVFALEALEQLEEGSVHWDRDQQRDIQSTYLGSVLTIYPSGKYYMPWTTNQTKEDVNMDTQFGNGMEEVLHDNEAWIESGEGDPLDLHICREV